MNKIQNFSNNSWTLLISLMAPSTVGLGSSSDNGNYDQVQMDFTDVYEKNCMRLCSRYIFFHPRSIVCYFFQHY